MVRHFAFVAQRLMRAIPRADAVAFYAAFFAFACLLTSSDSASASCGDYLDGHHWVTEELDETPSPLAPAQRDAPPVCNGPHCKPSPVAPATPASPLQDRSPEERFVVCPPPKQSPRTSPTHIYIGDDPTPTNPVAAGILEPPRA